MKQALRDTEKLSLDDELLEEWCSWRSFYVMPFVLKNYFAEGYSTIFYLRNFKSALREGRSSTAKTKVR